MIKKIFFLIVFSGCFLAGYAQILTPAKWQFSSKKVDDKTYDITFEVKLDHLWHIYSQNLKEGGPEPTVFHFTKNADYKLIGKVKENGKLEKKFDPNFDMELAYFHDRVRFVQRVELLKENAIVKGYVKYMVCDTMMCLPAKDQQFKFKLVGIAADTIATDTNTIDTIVEMDTAAAPLVTTIAEDFEEEDKPKSLWGIFIAGFIGGLLALLTPCVFPLIPLTVSFFTKRGQERGKGILHAVIYGISIIVIYVTIGFLVTKLLGSASILNEMATNIYFNMAFFIIFIVFAISFFGAFEITLPSSWVNKVDSASEKNGLLGIFFMAFTLALVSFSCTGPIIGTLLVEAAVGGHIKGPLMGMFGFSLALALPFTVFAIFPELLKSLPKSGGWLNVVKVTLGFLELALALKFLSNVDLAYHWGILDWEVFIVCWIVIFALLGFYLLGKLHFENDSEVTHIPIPRLLMSIMSFSFAMYLIPGLWGAPLKSLSGILPPIATFDPFYIPSKGTTATKYADILHCPHNLNCFFDYEEGMAYAKKVNKPVMLDFTGHNCANCRKMEAQVWSEPQVLNLIRDKYVLISLYVDDKSALPENERYDSKLDGSQVKTLGHKWSDLQGIRFNTNSQPYYVLLDHNGKELNVPKGYTPSVSEYSAFLQDGLNRFKGK